MILNKNVSVNGIDIFYREAGDRQNPTLLLLHGFPSSSVMFKELMEILSDDFHLIAPDYPGFGFSGFQIPTLQIYICQYSSMHRFLSAKH
ncbi:alpha/beta fold hydrolase [Dyadobacter crusticola]|uniref:alpha/beta fold hydrolase n=1 Tax=Dyadobacter crusticola TaxID=292407 RepID=UPI0009FFE3BE